MNKALRILITILCIASAETSFSQSSNALNKLKFGITQGCKEQQSKNTEGVYIIDEYLTSMCECTANNLIDSLSLDSKFSNAIKNKDYYTIEQSIKIIPTDYKKRTQLTCAESSLNKYGGISNIFVANKEETAKHATRTKNGGEAALKKTIFQSCYSIESKRISNAQEICTCTATEAYKRITITSLFSGDSSPIIEAAKICSRKIK